MITLSFVEQQHLSVLCNFSLPPEQLPFTSLPVDALRACEEDPTRTPIVILADQEPVGFFVLHEGEATKAYIEEEGLLLIRSLAIDEKQQGKGYGKKAMLLLPAFVTVHWPNIRELFLVVNERNAAAKQLYTRVGFEDRGLRRVGPIGPQRILHYDLLKISTMEDKKL
ncbi:GNAT family N-acetyltransferase [Halalkalibacterium halodurans]|jgi:ribosomal protein S18 acetylase RimI-like enzyme|uniref:BH3804 protein n=1 Tax=Halalkalibacterium halodurans (strain ATCC BAA-125 / DSM 18197 / FERM 7344 / JCM 9153 / C-125) TaxID=272558 RepID=Q9K6C5_HALH5|nr:GNAT family N-acetyltransferase [Halalkalibacterium halodurans]MDY7224308.1 GNAT family N-acetyltransferase [Halalkalibacterium halodurans]MDY7243593.1 GNAT family N-acetyltransferase [Halalkalibacterium halodurans]MED4079513.1 GNAT family N-acetyltransferase [Halalkalibacterium halodurans]MED4084210.1 GNAT family N-acetyltransferase [Halalkalibacterium halodurans]MED4104687.1 GNAT family N-acetyltransferase [Halalkalibacterium halodurans]